MPTWQPATPLRLSPCSPRRCSTVAGAVGHVPLEAAAVPMKVIVWKSCNNYTFYLRLRPALPVSRDDAILCTAPGGRKAEGVVQTS